MKHITQNRSLSNMLFALASLTSVACTAPAQAQVQLTWNDNSLSETNFGVERSSTAFGPWAGIANLPVNSTSYTDNYAAGGTTYYYRVKASNATWTSLYSNIATKTTPSPVTGTGTGLKGEYYGERNLTSLVVTQTDPTINFDWGSSSPNPSLNADNFSIRWTGQIQAQEGGTYTFQTQVDDRVRLWVNNVLLIDNWDAASSTVTTNVMSTLAANTKYSIKMEYRELGGSASARLKWMRPGQTTPVVVPQSQLFQFNNGISGGWLWFFGRLVWVNMAFFKQLVTEAEDKLAARAKAMADSSWSRVGGRYGYSASFFLIGCE